MIKDDFRKFNPSLEKRTHAITISCTAKEEESIKNAAKECGCNVSVYIRQLHKFVQEH